MNPTTQQDQDDVHRFKSGGLAAEAAFTSLVNRYSKTLYWQIRRMTRNHDESHDILQQIWIKVWKNLNNFQGESAFYTWLYRIMRNETFTWLQKEKKMNRQDMDPAFLEIVAGKNQLEHVSADQLSSWLLEAIDTLPEKQALVFQLRYFEEIPYQELAKQLGTSEGGLKANYHHAVQKIQENLLARLNH